MKTIRLRNLAAALALAACVQLTHFSLGAEPALRPALEPPDVTIDAPSVISPPESFFQMVSNRIARPAPPGRRSRRSQAVPLTPEAVAQELALYRAFYKKYIDVNGLPVVAHGDVADLALQRTFEIVTRMLAGRPDILEHMASNDTYLIIIGKNQLYTDMPEYRNHPNPEFQNERVRGTGGNPTSFGEENLLCLPIDRYDDESIAVHEFCHTIDSALRRIDPAWTDRRNAAFRNAVDNRLYHLTYAESNPAEYWAEIAQAYFDCNRINNWNHGPIGTRAQLQAHDPVGYELCRTAFNLKPEQDWRYSWLQTLPAITAPPDTPAFAGIDPWYRKFTWAREFTVLGHSAADRALLHANDTIRKMFAYRHDILKALIGEGLKLVVLAPDEKLSDLPEFQGDGASLIAAALRGSPDGNPPRSFSYHPAAKILVVPQESVLTNPALPGAGPNPVIRLFADALYKVAGTRPVIPDFRGDQQYELRVKRLDETFDQAVSALFDKARQSGKWAGTAAADDKFAYWTAGVLGYFNAAGQLEPPRDARAPINTREKLKEYDPALFDLVHETMAYGGKVDWRYTPPQP